MKTFTITSILACMVITVWLWIPLATSPTLDAGEQNLYCPSQSSSYRYQRQPVNTAQQTGTFEGTVQFDGKPPVLPALVKQGAEVKDKEVCSKKSIPDESLIVNQKNRGIANVFVYLRESPEGYEPPQDLKLPEVTLEMKDCCFAPHAMILKTGQTLNVKKKDKIPHNFHHYPLKNSSFGKIVSPTNEEQLSFGETEIVPIKVGCDIHPWMEGWILVVDHPFAAVTNQVGKFEIQGLPSGKHEFWFWQERAGWLEKKLVVRIEAGKATQVLHQYDAAKFELE